MSSVTEATTGCAAPHACTRACTHLITSAHAHTRSIIITDYEFVCARSVPRPRSTRSIFAFVILAGSLFSPYNSYAHCSRHSVASVMSVSCGYSYVSRGQFVC